MKSLFWDEQHIVDDFGRCYYLYGAEKKLCQHYFPDGGLILDLGCGAGRTTVPLHEAGYKVVGADLSFRMLTFMKRRFPYLNAVHADAAALPFASRKFDGVLFSYNGLSFLHPIDARHRAIAEIFRVLKTGGSFVLSAHNKTGIALNLRDRGLRTIPERWLAVRNMLVTGYVYEKKIKSQVYYSSVMRLIAELEGHGFQWEETMDRHGRFGLGFARRFDPWPYHCFRKERP